MASIDPAKATYAVIDVETTGMDPAVDRVVEIACVRLHEGRITRRFETLVDPGRPIPAEASAIHHILDADVRGQPALAEVAGRLTRLVEDAVVVAHNASFDTAFLPFVRHRPLLCSMRLAMHLVDAPSYGNQVLRRELGIDDPELRDMPPHRALADALVTARILQELLRRYERSGLPRGIDGLVAACAGPVKLRRLPFGAHRGTLIEDVPSDYLHWILAAGFFDAPDVRYSAERELASRARERPASLPMVPP
jgi:DNA polymerase III epsilon subunit family exonuclease